MNDLFLGVAIGFALGGVFNFLWGFLSAWWRNK
jgi:hypothetical protein